MSGTVRTGGAVSIPASVRKIIQDIKEIAGNHSDEEIYAMLKDCNMDPNETAQKLLFQDPFHEVKRKRDKRKEQNANSRDSGDTRSRPSNQGRGGRGAGRGNYLPRYISYDAGGGRGSNMARENGGHQSVNKASSNSAFPPTTSQNVQTKTNSPGTSSLPASTSGTSVIANGLSADAHAPQNQAGSWSPAAGPNLMADVLKSSSVQQSPTQPPRAPASTSVTVQGQSIASSQQYVASVTPTSVSGVYSSSSDPVLVPKLNSRVSGAVGTIKREVGTVGAERVVVEQATGSVDNKPAASSFSNTLQITQSDMSGAVDSEVKVPENEISASTTVHPFSQERVLSKSQTKDGDHVSDIQPQVSTSAPTGYSMSRSSVMGNHYIRPQQLIGSQKAVGPNKEWKPKPTNQNVAPSPGIIGTSTVSNSTSEVSRSPSPAAKSTLEDTSSKLQKNMEELNVRDEQHVIIPNHLQVPEAERTGLSFGSFDANFDANFGTSYSASYGNDDDSDKSSTPLSEESQVPEETVEEPSSSISNTTPVITNEEYPHHQRTSVTSVDNLSPSNDMAVSTNPTIVSSQSDPSKPDVVVQPGPQYSLVQSAPNYSGISLMPQMINSQYPSYEHAETQLRDVSRLPFVQPTYDPSTSYYTPFYRPGSDGDGRFSQLLGSTAASKYSGNVTILSGQSVPSSQESGNSMVLSNAAPTALGTQAAGLVQTTIALPQQPMPMFRQPTGVHISHYPPNYVPYHQFFSPFYLPSPTMHNIVGNSGFPQLPAGSSYPAAAGSSYPPAAAAGNSYPPAAAAVKYSLSQYKPGTASGNSPHIGVPAGYGSYTAAPSGYSASPSVTAGNASGCDDIGGSQYKENNVYIAGQQGEGSTVWFQGHPRDISGMQANSYYNLPPPQGQHMAFTHAQGGHATYAGLYHPTQSGPAPNAHPLLQQTQTLGGGAVGVVGAQAGVYQQPQRAQLNWANSY